MKISDMIALLERKERQYGDIDITIMTDTYEISDGLSNRVFLTKDGLLLNCMHEKNIVKAKIGMATDVSEGESIL